MFAIRRTFTVTAMVRQPVVRLAAPASRSFAGPLDKKQKAEEKAYFSKKDAKLMKALLEKMEAKGDMPAYKEEACAAGEDLDHIFETHKLDKDGAHKELYGELMDWKKHDY